MSTFVHRALGVAVGTVCIGAAVASVTPRMLPLTEPPISVEIANKVTSFANDHPEFAVLRDGRKDATGIKFPHDKHLNNPSVKAKEWKGEDRTLNCVDCHESDESGMYFKPVTFENHCAVCHSSNLGQIEVAEGVVKSQPTPHGNEAEIAAVVRGQIHEWLAVTSTKPADAPGAAPAEEAKPASGGGRRGRGGGGAGGESAPKKSSLQTPKSADELAATIVEQSDKVFKDLARNTKCGYCHTVEKAETKGSPFVVKNPHIPDRWMTRSVFSHEAHAMVSCQSCHAVEKSASAADINLPDIKSCRECHSPMSAGEAALGSHGAGDSCVMCHVYHPKGETLKQGKLRPQDLMRK